MFTLARLAIDSPLQFDEQLGDPVTNLGGAPVPALRTALRHAVSIPTFTGHPSADLQTDRLRLRRQLRSMLNNSPYKLRSWYLAWDEDPEQNGWYVVDQGQLADGTGNQTALATGWWKIENFSWLRLGHPRTHRRAVSVYLKDRRLSTTPRDYQRQIYSTDFAGLTALAITYLPCDLTDLQSTGAITAAYGMAVVDGGAPVQLVGGVDLATVSYEQPETSRLRGDVLVYDRRGTLTAPSGGPDAAWEEVYGPDYPWSWIGGTIDTPVLANGRCRVRFDASNAPGWAIDVWNGTAWIEQGKAIIFRVGDTTSADDTWLSASLLDYDQDRAVIRVVMAASADAISRETIYVTLQRGWSGPRFEVYPANKSTGTADASIRYVVHDAGNDSAVKIDTSAAIVATAGTGSGNFPTTTVGTSTFTGENEVAILSQGEAYSPQLAVVQAGATAGVLSDTNAYASARNAVRVYGNAAGLGYISAHLGFAPQASDQMLEAESFRNASGTTSQVADGSASGGQTVKDTQTAATNPTCTKTSNLQQAKYRILMRVKVDSGATGSFRALLGATASVTVTSTSTAYTWLDLGDMLAPAASSTLALYGWRSAGSSSVYIDRVEIFKLEDRTQTVAGYDGARDLGQAVLNDSRGTATVVAR
jgi:hypothetical protein